MSDYQARFDAQTASAQSAVANLIADLDDALPGLRSADVRRMLANISKLLGKVDKGSVTHAEYLARSPSIIPEYAIEVVSAIPTHAAAGAGTFVQSSLPGLVLVEERLTRAAGPEAYRIKDVKNAQVRELQQIGLDAQEILEDLQEKFDRIEKAFDEANATVEGIKGDKKTSAEGLDAIATMRKAAEKLASGDLRGMSLERVVRNARAKLAEIESALKRAGDAADSASGRANDIEQLHETAENHVSALEENRSDAQKILSLSSEAGLAASYLQEASRLKWRSTAFTTILYVTVGLTIWIASSYVFPSLEHIVSSEGTLVNGRSITVALLRATILAPLVYVIFFTSRQITSVELLRMDYAEKAAASLAYSGYRDEMSVDPGLLERLKASLLLKFAEHPERLLRKHRSTETITVSAPGFEAQSRSAPAPEAGRSAPAAEE